MTETISTRYTLWSVMDTTYLDMLPEGKEDGSIFGEEGQWKIYFRNYLLSVGFLLTTLLLFHAFFTLTGHAVYAKKDRSDKVEYLGLWNANVHHIVVCIMVIYFAKNSQCENAYDFMFLFDPVCAYTVDYGVVTPVLFTSAYLSYDFVLHFTLVENRGPMYI